MTRCYCRYCGRVQHRCACADEASRLRQFLARNPHCQYTPHWMTAPYQRGVPPQVKRRERAILRKHYRAWYADLVAVAGEQCAHCGTSDPPLVIDHVLSIAKGGKSIRDNLQLLCAECNRLKGKLWYDCDA